MNTHFFLCVVSLKMVISSQNFFRRSFIRERETERQTLRERQRQGERWGKRILMWCTHATVCGVLWRSENNPRCWSLPPTLCFWDRVSVVPLQAAGSLAHGLGEKGFSQLCLLPVFPIGALGVADAYPMSLACRWFPEIWTLFLKHLEQALLPIEPWLQPLASPLDTSH